jgi:hypothetical protein
VSLKGLETKTIGGKKVILTLKVGNSFFPELVVYL